MIWRIDFDMLFGNLIFVLLLCCVVFAKALAFACWLILKMVSFRKYLVFFLAVLLHTTTLNDYRMDFVMFFELTIFDPK